MGYKYRFRTAALVGNWFTSARMASADAIRAGQAYRNADGALIWRGDGRLEVVAKQEPLGAGGRTSHRASAEALPQR